MGSGWNKDNRGLWASDGPKSGCTGLFALIVVFAILGGVLYYFGFVNPIRVYP